MLEIPLRDVIDSPVIEEVFIHLIKEATHRNVFTIKFEDNEIFDDVTFILKSLQTQSKIKIIELKRTENSLLLKGILKYKE